MSIADTCSVRRSYMPQLEHAGFTYDFEGANIIFNVSADLSMTDSEVNSEWTMEIAVMEKDVVADDVVFKKSLALTTPKLFEKCTFAISVPRDMVNTEGGGEEIYCILRLFRTADTAGISVTAQTPVVKIDI